LEGYFAQDKLRPAGQQGGLPKVSRLLDALVRENRIDLMQPPERKLVAEFLQQIATKAPSVHISFAADPSSEFTAKIVQWLRANVHPYTLLQLGLQPSIAAGCEVRTPNHVFDFSLRHRFFSQRTVLQNALRGLQEAKK